MTRRLLALIVVNLSFMAAADGRAPVRAITIEDVLRLEGVGEMILLPGGRHLIYEKVPAYVEAPNIGSQVTLLFRGPLAHLYILGVDSRKTQPLFAQERDTGYWIGSLSPNGARLALYSLKGSELKARVVDLDTHRVSTLGFTPACCWPRIAPIWIDDYTLVYVTTAPGAVPSVVHRSDAIPELTRLWQESIAGNTVTATIRISRADQPAEVANDVGQGALVRVDLRSGATSTLVRGNFVSVYLSPDSRHLAALRREGWIQQRPDQPPGSQTPFRSELLVIDHNKLQVQTPCLGCNTLLASVAWSSSSDRLTFIAHDVARGLESAKASEFRLVEAKTVDLDTMGFEFACHVAVQGYGARPLLLPVPGGAIAYGRRRTGTTGPVSGFASCDLSQPDDWHFLASQGSSLNATAKAAFNKPDPRLISDPRPGAGPDQRVVIHQGTRLSVTHQQTLTEIAIPHDAKLQDFDVHSGRAIFRRDTERGSHLLLAERGRPARRILSINPVLSEFTRAREKIIEYDTRGRRVKGCVLTPPGATAKQNHPTVVVVYPGASGDCWLSDFSGLDPTNWLNMQVLAAQGIAVLFPALSMDLIRTPEGPTQNITQLVQAGVDAAIAVGYAREGSLGIFGFSQGMHEVLQIITETTRFQAAFASNGVANFSSHYGTNTLDERLGSEGLQYTGHPSRYEGAYSANSIAGPPWGDPQAYVRNSPIFYANRIQTPLLLMHADLDGEFPSSQAEEIFTALYRLGREARFITYWGEGHGNRSPANIAHAWHEIISWFTTHLIPPDSGRTYPSVVNGTSK